MQIESEHLHLHLRLQKLFCDVRDIDELKGDIFFSNEAVSRIAVPNQFLNCHQQFNRVREFFLDWYTRYDAENINYKISALTNSQIEAFITDFEIVCRVMLSVHTP